MFRNCLSAAWSDLVRSPLESLIAIGGLAIGLISVILVAGVVINQLSFDHGLPGYQRTYIATTDLGGPVPSSSTPHDLAARLKNNVPEIEAVARLVGPHMQGVRHGAVEALEPLYDADPDIFRALPLPVAYGDLNSALASPDGVVITRAIAHKYFGHDNVVGETLELDRKRPLKITAVIENLPENNSNLQAQIFISGKAAGTQMAVQDAGPSNGPASGFIMDSITFVRLRPGASMADLQPRLAALNDTLLPHPSFMHPGLYMAPLGDFHLSAKLFPNDRQRLNVLAMMGAVVFILACVNFVNLVMARSARRGIEIGVRKAAGAGRRHLIAQFLGEAVLQAGLAMVLAMVAVEWLLPAVNDFLVTGAQFQYWRDPVLMLGLLAGVLLTGILAGAWPAFILSSLNPVKALSGLMRWSPGAAFVKTALVTLQFTVLAGLAIGSLVAYQQYNYVVGQAVNLDTGDTLFVRAYTCDGKFKDGLPAIPGVEAVACTTRSLLQENNFYSRFFRRDGTQVDILRVNTGPGALELYGLQPLAGRFTSAGNVADMVPADAAPDRISHYVINQTAMTKMGYSSPQDAIGKVVALEDRRGEIIGVVRDFWVYSGNRKADPVAYIWGDATLNPQNSPRPDVLVHIKLNNQATPATLTAVDALWNASGTSAPIQRSYMHSYIELKWLSLLREDQVFSIFAGIGILLAALGLFATARGAAERRTKEIGIRKAMGAGDGEVIRLLLWQFARPVLWANVIAWPLTYWLTERWLISFPYHIAMPLWVFPAVGIASIAIAVLTVFGQALGVARQKPVLALRYE